MISFNSDSGVNLFLIFICSHFAMLYIISAITRSFVSKRESNIEKKTVISGP